MILRFRAILLAIGLLMAAEVHAAPYEFANFNLLNANQPFSFSNNTVYANIAVTNAPVTFNFTQQTGLSTADHAAFLNIALMVPSTVVPATLSGFLLDQPINLLEQLTITSGMNGTGTNYLTMTFEGDITGFLNTTVANLSGTDGPPNNPSFPPFAFFASDFGTFTQPGNSFQLGLSTLSAPLAQGPGGFLNSFAANINGQFSANFTANVPEPSAIALLSLGLICGIGLGRKRAG